MRTLAAALSLALLAVPASLPARDPAPAATAQPVRLDARRIERTLDGFVADGRTVGASVLVWQNGRERLFSAAGMADREAVRPFARDTLVQVFSMTKPVTGVALMQLWEQGKFALDDPLAKHLPEFAQVQVLAGEDASGQPILRAPSRPILVRDVLRHTAGFGYGWEPGLAGRLWAAQDPLALTHDLAEFGRRLARVPLLHDPGERWNYSAAVDVQALLVERLSGEKFADYVQAHIFGPLGMTQSAWAQPADRLPRLAQGYSGGPAGPLAPVPEAQRTGPNFGGGPMTWGGAGVATTIDDYMRFARMLLGDGSLDGVRILRPSTVRLMATDQLDPVVTERGFLPGKGALGFGFDFAVRNLSPQSPQESRGAVGEFFWDGMFSTLFWVDPANDMAVVFFTQKVPFDGTLHHDIRAAVYGAGYLGPAGD